MKYSSPELRSSETSRGFSDARQRVRFSYDLNMDKNKSFGQVTVGKELAFLDVLHKDLKRNGKNSAFLREILSS